MIDVPLILDAITNARAEITHKARNVLNMAKSVPDDEIRYFYVKSAYDIVVASRQSIIADAAWGIHDLDAACSLDDISAELRQLM